MEPEIEDGFLLKIPLILQRLHRFRSRFFQELERVKKKFPNLFRSAMYMGGYWASIFFEQSCWAAKSVRTKDHPEKF